MSIFVLGDEPVQDPLNTIGTPWGQHTPAQRARPMLTSTHMWERGFLSEIDIESLPMWVFHADGEKPRYFKSRDEAQDFLACWRICQGREPNQGEVR